MTAIKTTGRPTSLGQRVAAEVRAEMARQRHTQRALARRLGVIEAWLSRRLHGQVAMTLDDLEKIAGEIGVPVEVLISRAQLGYTVPEEYLPRPSHRVRSVRFGRPGERRPLRLDAVVDAA